MKAKSTFKGALDTNGAQSKSDGNCHKPNESQNRVISFICNMTQTMYVGCSAKVYKLSL